MAYSRSRADAGVCCSGVMLLVMGVFKLGFSANFLVQHPSFSGFYPPPQGVIIAARPDQTSFSGIDASGGIWQRLMSIWANSGM